jgi:hypothetical protein
MTVRLSKSRVLLLLTWISTDWKPYLACCAKDLSTLTPSPWRKKPTELESRTRFMCLDVPDLELSPKRGSAVAKQGTFSTICFCESQEGIEAKRPFVAHASLSLVSEGTA